jgi:hypothetical protein
MSRQPQHDHNKATLATFDCNSLQCQISQCDQDRYCDLKAFDILVFLTPLVP